jgi:hypothetical protein
VLSSPCRTAAAISRRSNYRFLLQECHDPARRSDILICLASWLLGVWCVLVIFSLFQIEPDNAAQAYGRDDVTRHPVTAKIATPASSQHIQPCIWHRSGEPAGVEFVILTDSMDTRSEGVQYAAAIVSITTGMRDGAAPSLTADFALTAGSRRDKDCRKDCWHIYFGDALGLAAGAFATR